jgi:hypothetical protein
LIAGHPVTQAQSTGGKVTAPGRACPLAYRYQPEALGEPASLAAETLYVVGGLYGNMEALRAVIERADREPDGAAIVFNGDFHWLDVDPDDFQTVQQTVLRHHAIKGNVEAELAASDSSGGCGCTYPDYVDDAKVERSNAIMARLRSTARRFPDLVDDLDLLPRYLVAEVGGCRVGIVHGDPESISGWGLALEAMEPGDPAVRREVGWHGEPTTPARVADWFDRAGVDVLASTHTGLPYAQDFWAGARQRLVINNGTAGIGNFVGTTHGVLTRLSASPVPPTDSLYGIALGRLRCDALPVGFDLARFEASFLTAWPPGSPAHQDYFARMHHGTSLQLRQAARGDVRV